MITRFLKVFSFCSLDSFWLREKEVKEIKERLPLLVLSP